MKICVFGAGAVGSHIAVRSQLGGAETRVVARGEQLNAIRERGLTVQTPDRELNVAMPASDNPADLGPQDIVIVTVKSPALGSVANSIGPLLGPDTSVLFAMNGIPWWYFYKVRNKFDDTRLDSIDINGLIWKHIGPSRAVGGVVFSACSIVKPGVVRLAGSNNRLVIGEPAGGESGRSLSIAEILTRGGLQTDVTGNIRDKIWQKLLNNVASGLMAILTQSRVDLIAAQPACEKAMRALLAETIEIANAHGCDPDTEIDSVIDFMKRLKHKPSILQDLESGRLMEFESTFGIVARLARMVEITTPTLDLMVTLSRLRTESAGLLIAEQ